MLTQLTAFLGLGTPSANAGSGQRTPAGEDFAAVFASSGQSGRGAGDGIANHSAKPGKGADPVEPTDPSQGADAASGDPDATSMDTSDVEDADGPDLRPSPEAPDDMALDGDLAKEPGEDFQANAASGREDGARKSGVLGPTAASDAEPAGAPDAAPIHAEQKDPLLERAPRALLPENFIGSLSAKSSKAQVASVSGNEATQLRGSQSAPFARMVAGTADHAPRGAGPAAAPDAAPSPKVETVSEAVTTRAVPREIAQEGQRRAAVSVRGDRAQPVADATAAESLPIFKGHSVSMMHPAKVSGQRAVVSKGEAAAVSSQALSGAATVSSSPGAPSGLVGNNGSAGLSAECQAEPRVATSDPRPITAKPAIPAFRDESRSPTGSLQMAEPAALRGSATIPENAEARSLGDGHRMRSQHMSGPVGVEAKTSAPSGPSESVVRSGKPDLEADTPRGPVATLAAGTSNAQSSSPLNPALGPAVETKAIGVAPKGDAVKPVALSTSETVEPIPASGAGALVSGDVSTEFRVAPSLSKTRQVSAARPEVVPSSEVGWTRTSASTGQAGDPDPARMWVPQPGATKENARSRVPADETMPARIRQDGQAATKGPAPRSNAFVPAQSARLERLADPGSQVAASARPVDPPSALAGSYEDAPTEVDVEIASARKVETPVFVSRSRQSDSGVMGGRAIGMPGSDPIASGPPGTQAPDPTLSESKQWRTARTEPEALRPSAPERDSALIRPIATQPDQALTRAEPAVGSAHAGQSVAQTAPAKVTLADPPATARPGAEVANELDPKGQTVSMTASATVATGVPLVVQQTAPRAGWSRHDPREEAPRTRDRSEAEQRVSLGRDTKNQGSGPVASMAAGARGLAESKLATIAPGSQGFVTAPFLADLDEGPEFEEAVLGPAESRGPGAPTLSGSPTAASLPKADPAAVMRQVAEAIPRGVDGGVEVTLSPEELGRVRFHIHSGEHGLVVQVAADRPETLDLMRRHADQLARNFAEAGYDGASFSFGDGGASGQERPSDTAAGPDTDLPLAEAAPTTAAAQSQPQTDGLDIRI